MIVRVVSNSSDYFKMVPGIEKRLEKITGGTISLIYLSASSVAAGTEAQSAIISPPWSGRVSESRELPQLARFQRGGDLA
jgi:hypothetical protein